MFYLDFTNTFFVATQYFVMLKYHNLPDNLPTLNHSDYIPLFCFFTIIGNTTVNTFKDFHLDFASTTLSAVATLYLRVGLHGFC